MNIIKGAVRRVLSDFTLHEGDDIFKDLYLLIEHQWHLLAHDLPRARLKLPPLMTSFREKYSQLISASSNMKDFLSGIELALTVHDDALNRISWLKESVNEKFNEIPHMLYDESFLYYKWLGRTYSGRAEIVEIGCWMGATTFLLADGLNENQKATGQKIHAIDSFEWNNEMKLYGDHKNLENLQSGDDFSEKFKAYTNCYKHLIETHNYKFDISNELNKTKLKSFITGSDKKIEYLIQDISPSYAFNKYVWDIFSPYFIDGETMVVYGQYGNIFANDLRQFVLDYSDQLTPIHKVKGNVKTFLYRKTPAEKI